MQYWDYHRCLLTSTNTRRNDVPYNLCHKTMPSNPFVNDIYFHPHKRGINQTVDSDNRILLLSFADQIFDLTSQCISGFLFISVAGHIVFWKADGRHEDGVQASGQFQECHKSATRVNS